MIDIVSCLERNDGLFADLHCYVNQDYVAAIKKGGGICCSSSICKFIWNHPNYLYHLRLRFIVLGYSHILTIQTLLIVICTL